jgi:murein peptide amidase A
MISLEFFNRPIFRHNDTVLMRKMHRAHIWILRATKYTVAGIFICGFAYLIVGFYIPATIQFMPNTANCVRTPTILPRQISHSPSEHYKVITSGNLTALGYPLLSTHVCVVPAAIPPSVASEIQVRSVHVPIPKKLKIINTANLSVSTKSTGEQVSTKSNIIFDLSQADLFFDYSLRVNGSQADCITQETTVSCPISKLKLTQGMPYTFVLDRTLGSSSVPVYQENLTTLSSVELLTSTISDSQIVYDSPKNIELKFSKPINNVQGVVFSQSSTELPVAYKIIDSVLTVSWPSDLDRQNTYGLSIDNIKAKDGSYLEKPILVTFSTSAGPKVVDTTLPKSRSATQPSFSITFDQPVDEKQDLTQIITLVSGGRIIPISLIPSGNKIKINSEDALPRCQEFSVQIAKKLLSNYGITAENDQTINSRTECTRQFSIGTSVEGRPIPGYTIGNGADKIFYIGTIHGNERSSQYLLSDWIDWLETNPEKIPSGKTIVILPLLNPDGYASNSRFNAHNVDLNRNFGSLSWKKDVKVPGGGILENGGGSAPLSEPETKALIDYITEQDPSLIISYHSQGSIVIPNGSGNSAALALLYAESVKYQYVQAETENTFEHDTTGALEDWLYESAGIPTVLLELNSHNNPDLFNRHKNAMLDMLR